VVAELGKARRFLRHALYETEGVVAHWRAHGTRGWPDTDERELLEDSIQQAQAAIEDLERAVGMRPHGQ
jgi:hypothetical protein